MDQKPTSRGVRNKQKQNKALALRWKAVHWAAGPCAQGYGKGSLPRGCCLWRRPRRLECEVSSHSFPFMAVLGALHSDQMVAGARFNREDKKRGKYLPCGSEMASPQWGVCVQYLSLNKILVALLNHE